MTNVVRFPSRNPAPRTRELEDELATELVQEYQLELREIRKLRRRISFWTGPMMALTFILRLIVMLICLLPLLLALWLFTVVSAKAGPVMQTIHNGSLMTMTQTPGGMVVQYANPRPDLFGLVVPGTVLLEGRWVGPAPQIFVGTAFVFSRWCGAIPYPVRGAVDQSQSLMLFGAAPIFDTACRILGYSLESQQAVLRFEPVK